MFNFIVEVDAAYSSRKLLRNSVVRWTKATRAPVLGTRLGLDDLIDGEEYEFRVLAQNEAGTGRPSLSSGPIKIKDPYGN